MRISLDERLKIAKLHIYEDVSVAQLAKDFNAKLDFQKTFAFN